MSSRPKLNGVPYCTWLPGVAPPRTPRFLASPLFLPCPPPLCLCSTFPTAFWSHRSHSVWRETHLPFTAGRTLIQWPPQPRISLFWRSSNHFSRPVVPPYLSSTWAPTPSRRRFTLPPEALMMLMMHYSPSIESLASQPRKNNQFFNPKRASIFLLSPTRLWVSPPKLARVRPPPLTHFVRPTQLQPSLLAGFRDSVQLTSFAFLCIQLIATLPPSLLKPGLAEACLAPVPSSGPLQTGCVSPSVLRDGQCTSSENRFWHASFAMLSPHDSYTQNQTLCSKKARLVSLLRWVLLFIYLFLFHPLFVLFVAFLNLPTW